MALTREQKETQVRALTDELRNSQLSVLVSFSGLSVSQAQDLRVELKKAGGNFRIVKNAMFKRAVNGIHKDLDVADLNGPLAIAFGYDDQILPAKIIVDYAKKNTGLEPAAAINDKGELLTADEVKRLASLPSREALTAQLVGTVAAPLSGFMNVLQGNIRGLVTALDAAAKQNPMPNQE